MKTITITVEKEEGQEEKEYELECLTVMRGQYFYECLVGLSSMLRDFDKNKKLQKEEQELLSEIRKKAAPFLKGI